MKLAIRAALALIPILAGTCGAVRAAEPLRLRYLAAAYADSAGAPLSDPRGVACGEGVVAVADSDGRIALYDTTGKTLRASGVFTPRETPIPVAAAFDPKGDLLVVDGRSRRIVRVSRAGEAKGSFEAPAGPDGRQAVPRAIAVDREGRIYVLDVASGVVSVLSVAGAPARRIALPESDGLTDVAVSGDGAVLVTDAVGGRLLVAPAGGASAAALPSTFGSAVEFASSVASDAFGRVIVLDGHGGRVALARPDGSIAVRQLEFGWDSGQLRNPADLCVDPAGRLLVADRDNRRVQMFQIAD